MKELKFTYQRTKEDFMNQALWYRFNYNKINLFLNILFPIFGIATLIGSFTIGEIDTLQYVAIAYLILFPGINILLTKVRVNSMFRNPNVAFDNTNYVINSVGINIASEKGEFLLEWDKVYRVVESKMYVYIFFSRREALQVNKEDLGEINVSLLKEIVTENFNKHLVKFK